MLVIKRYSNRKLYNTETKQYITLDEIAELIRQGDEIHVIDNDSGDDITALTMTQIIFEQVKKQAGFLPHTVLTGLIQAGGSRISSIQRTLTSSLGMRHNVDDEIVHRIQSLVGRGDLTPEEGDRMQDLLVSDRAKEPVSTETVDESVVKRVLDERGVASRSEIQKILRQIENLSSKLDDVHPE